MSSLSFKIPFKVDAPFVAVSAIAIRKFVGAN